MLINRLIVCFQASMSAGQLSLWQLRLHRCLPFQQVQHDCAVLVTLRELAADTEQHTPMLTACAMSCGK